MENKDKEVTLSKVVFTLLFSSLIIIIIIGHVGIGMPLLFAVNDLSYLFTIPISSIIAIVSIWICAREVVKTWS